ncbi:MAG: UvrD-helicase domain-containing protein [Firmicutes bacterium]|nr:UvrD-helicase domain-containing protein [Bacillota bacterium]
MNKYTDIPYLSTLNEPQLEAATHTEGPLLILAGAGSGKTATMTRRIAYMILEKNISPYHILAVTFTNKAAKEMRERVESLVGGHLNMWIMTFHSACLRILRMNAELAGYADGFVIYDPVDQKTVIKNLIKSQNVDDKMFTPNYVLSVISDAKEKGVDSSRFGANAASIKEKVLARLYQGYEKTLKKNNAMDFDDMIWKTVKLFRQYPDVLEEYRNRFRYIMVDEYQDTNTMQYQLVKALAAEHRNICVVGDDDQCIYEWRGADIRNILSFEKDFPGAKVIKLEQNYRSSGNILKAAHDVISHNRGRKDKRLWTASEDGSLLTYKRLDNEKAEARFVAGQIQDMVLDGGRRYGDFAVLYRTNAQSRAFEEFFRGTIPYEVRGSLKFYDRKEIKDMIAYLRLVVNPSDEVAFDRVINEPKRGLGDRTVEKIRVIAAQRGVGMLDVLADEEVVSGLSAKAGAGARSFVSLIAECRSMMNYGRDEDTGHGSVSDIYDRILVGSGYLASLENSRTIEAESRIENLLEFKSAIIDRELEDGMLTLTDFLEQMTLDADVEKTEGEETDRVVLMTMHSAKGLEFPVVFMPGMEDGLFPGRRSMDSEAGLEEERRLCYVGITRAKESLFLSSAITRTLYGRTDYTRESQFLKEIDPSLLDPDSDRVGRYSYPENTMSGTTGVTYTRTSRPFDPVRQQSDQLKRKNRELRRSAPARSNAAYRQGMKVRHAKFGDGLIIETDGSVLKVAFDRAGIKKLAAGVAPLEILE